MIATRLGDADPSLSVMVLEGGRGSLSDLTVTNPLYFMEIVLPSPGVRNPTRGLCTNRNRANPMLRIGAVHARYILGGGSSRCKHAYLHSNQLKVLDKGKERRRRFTRASPAHEAGRCPPSYYKPLPKPSYPNPSPSAQPHQNRRRGYRRLT